MTFNEICTNAATKVGEIDSATLTFALQVCLNRYRILWNAHDWPETKQPISISVPANATGFFTDQIYGEAMNVSWRKDITQTPQRGEYRDLSWIKQNDPFVIQPGIVGPLPRYYWQAQPLALPFDAITSIQFNVLAQNGDNVDIIISGSALVNGIPTNVTETLSISTGQPASFFPQNAFTQVFTVSKGQGASVITVAVNGSATPTAVLPAAPYSLEYCHYKFYPNILVPFIVDAEMKLKCPQNLVGNDTPIIKHLEDALIAYTQCDLLERQRQYTKSQAKSQEAQTFLQAAKNIQRDQADYVQQITPDMYDLNWCAGLGRYRVTSSYF